MSDTNAGRDEKVGPWLADYRAGRTDFAAGFKNQNLFQYDGPYRVGWFEASQGISPERAEEIGRKYS